MVDIVGIGGLNVDFIAGRSRLKKMTHELVDELQKTFEFGIAKRVSRKEITDVLTLMGAYCDNYPGGSAFNAIQTLAALEQGLELGFIGTLAVSQGGQIDFNAWFKDHGVDRSFVKDFDGEEQGMCVSLINEGERQLIVYPGINRKFPEILRVHKDAIVEYLSHAKVIHFSSLLDTTSPGLLLEILSLVARKNPATAISFDPGYEWVNNPTSEIRDLIKQANILFLNHTEFKLVAGSLPGDNDLARAQRIFSGLVPSSIIVLLKKYDEIILFRRVGREVVSITHPNRQLLPQEIEDATGAGDVFAAGFLAGKLNPLFEIHDCIELGLRLVHAKLRAVGTTNFTSFPQIYRNLVEEIRQREYGAPLATRPTLARRAGLALGMMAIGAALAEFIQWVIIPNWSRLWDVTQSRPAVSVIAAIIILLVAWGLQRYLRLEGAPRVRHWLIWIFAAAASAFFPWLHDIIGAFVAAAVPIAVALIELYTAKRGVTATK